MMRRPVKKVSIDAGSLILLALMLLVLPLRWIAAALFAAAVHELGHVVGIWLCGSRTHSIEIGQGGALLRVETSSRGKELFCTVMGPLFGVLLMLLVRFFPRAAVCAAVQTLYNLLPIYPLDGGRALKCLADMWLSPKASGCLCKWAERICLTGIGLTGLYATFFLHLGLLPLLVCAALCAKVLSRNTTCKE